MLLLYSEEVDEAGQAARWAEMPEWLRVTESLREAGLLVANSPLHETHTATTVRVRNEEVELTDGPFAVTKEILAGYYVLSCSNLDEALRQAARLPTARYGSVEVRPIMEASEIPRADDVASAGEDIASVWDDAATRPA
jgi:hypothetical protein